MSWHITTFVCDVKGEKQQNFKMKIALILLCFVAAAYGSYREQEYHSNDYRYDSTRVTQKYADNYRYDVGSYRRGSYKRKCNTYRSYYKGVCKSYAYGSGYGGSICKSTPCDFSATHGLNKCNKRVYLNKPYYCPGKECAYNKDTYCQKGYSTHRSGYGGSSGYGYGHRPAPSCRCQTVWCVKKVYAVIRDYTPKHGGYDKEQVRISYPCRCSCRQKY